MSLHPASTTAAALLATTILATSVGPAHANRSVGQGPGTVIIVPSPPPQPFPVRPHPHAFPRAQGPGTAPFGSSMPPSLPFGQAPQTFNPPPLTPPTFQQPRQAFPSRRTQPEFLPQPQRQILPPDSVFRRQNP